MRVHFKYSDDGSMVALELNGTELIRDIKTMINVRAAVHARRLPQSSTPSGESPRLAKQDTVFVYNWFMHAIRVTGRRALAARDVFESQPTV